MSAPDKPTNPDRYKDSALVFNKVHGWGRTFNPRVESYMVEVKFATGQIISIHEDELFWPISYEERCVVLGNLLAEKGGFSWLYTPNKDLDNKSPMEAIEGGKLDLVVEVFNRAFYY